MIFLRSLRDLLVLTFFAKRDEPSPVPIFYDPDRKLFFIRVNGITFATSYSQPKNRFVRLRVVGTERISWRGRIEAHDFLSTKYFIPVLSYPPPQRRLQVLLIELPDLDAILKIAYQMGDVLLVLPAEGSSTMLTGLLSARSKSEISLFRLLSKTPLNPDKCKYFMLDNEWKPSEGADEVAPLVPVVYAEEVKLVET